MLTAATDIPGPALLSSVTENSTAGGGGSTSGPAPPGTFSSYSAFTSAPSSSQSGTPQPNHRSSAFAPPSRPGPDPFASLSSVSTASKPAAGVLSARGAPVPDDDEWSFSSALPLEAPPQPREHRATVGNGDVKVELYAARAPATANAMSLQFAFSNNTAEPLSELHFQTAVTKVSPRAQWAFISHREGLTRAARGTSCN